MLAFTSKSNTLRLGRFRSWAVRPYLHKKVNTTFLTRCCLYLVAYLSAYMRLWGAWLVAYSVLFSRDRIIIHAFYWRFPLVKGRHSRYGLCWLSNYYVPCLSRVKSKREFLYNQTPIAYTTSRKFMTYTPVSYADLKQRTQNLRLLSAQAPASPLMHFSISGKWNPVVSLTNRWNTRAAARQLRHERRRTSRLSQLLHQWNSVNTLGVSTQMRKVRTPSADPALPAHVQLTTLAAKNYWYPRRHNPTYGLKLRRRALRQRVERRSPFHKLKHLSWKTRFSLRRKYVRSFPRRSPVKRSRHVKRRNVPVTEPVSFLLPLHAQLASRRRRRNLALLNIRRTFQTDYNRSRSASRTSFAQRNYWHPSLRQQQSTTMHNEVHQVSTNWLRAYRKRTTHAPSTISHWNLAQFAQFRRTFSQRTRLSPKSNRHQLRAKHSRTTFGQRRFILGRSLLDARRCLYPLRRRRHRKLALITAANWRFAPVQTVPFIQIYRNALTTRETDVLVTKAVTVQAQNYVKKTELRAANKAKRRTRTVHERSTLRTLRTQRRNIRYYQQVELIAREMRRLRWRQRQVKRRKSTSVFGIARLLLHPTFTTRHVVKSVKGLDSLRNSTKHSCYKQSTTMQATTNSAAQTTRQLTNYLRIMERLSRRKNRRRLLRRKQRTRYNKWKLSTKRIRQEQRRPPVQVVTIAQQIPCGRMLLPLPTVIGQLGAKMTNSHLTHLMISHALVGSLYNQTLRFFMARTWAANYTETQGKDTPLITNVTPNSRRPHRAGTRYRGRVQSFSKFRMFQSYLGTRLQLALKDVNSTFTQI